VVPGGSFLGVAYFFFATAGTESGRITSLNPTVAKKK